MKNPFDSGGMSTGPQTFMLPHYSLYLFELSEKALLKDSGITDLTREYFADMNHYLKQAKLAVMILNKKENPSVGPEIVDAETRADIEKMFTKAGNMLIFGNPSWKMDRLFLLQAVSFLKCWLDPLPTFLQEG